MTNWVKVAPITKRITKMIRFQTISGARNRIVIAEPVMKEAGLKLGQYVDVLFSEKNDKMRITSGEDHIMKKDPASSINNGSIDLRLPFAKPKGIINYTAKGGTIDVDLQK